MTPPQTDRHDDSEGPGMFASKAFWCGGFLSVCAWSVVAFAAIVYFS